jgi:hypothetical protein
MEITRPILTSRILNTQASDIIAINAASNVKKIPLDGSR